MLHRKPVCTATLLLTALPPLGACDFFVLQMNHMSGIAIAYFLNDRARQERIAKQYKQARRSKAVD